MTFAALYADDMVMFAEDEMVITALSRLSEWCAENNTQASKAMIRHDTDKELFPRQHTDLLQVRWNVTDITKLAQLAYH